LEKERDELERKKEKIGRAIKDLKDQKNKVKQEITSLGHKKDESEDFQAGKEAKKLRLDVFINFVKGIQNALAAAPDLYKNKKRRDAFRAKMSDIEQMSLDPAKTLSRFKTLYRYCLEQSELKSLQSDDLEKLFDEAGEFIDDILLAINEVFQPKFVFDSAAGCFSCRGYFLTWQECQDALNKFIDKQLKLHGLSLNKGKLNVKNDNDVCLTQLLSFLTGRFIAQAKIILIRLIFTATLFISTRYFVFCRKLAWINSAS